MRTKWLLLAAGLAALFMSVAASIAVGSGGRLCQLFVVGSYSSLRSKTPIESASLPSPPIR